MKHFSPYTKKEINDIIEKEIPSVFFLKQERDYQKDIMRSILSGNDTFAILPTGAGKSICFQAPSVFFPGITLVISPLIALIEDQVNNFNNPEKSPKKDPEKFYHNKNICFKAIHPGKNPIENPGENESPNDDYLSLRAMFSKIQKPQEISDAGCEVRYKLLYVSPERLCMPKFLRALQKAEEAGLRINHIVIDEVHCMSQWGFDFRESYLYIANFIKHRPERPIISAFTATATLKDIAEIKNILDFPVGQVKYGNPVKYKEKKYAEFFEPDMRKLDKKYKLPSLKVISCSTKTRSDELIKILNKNITKVCVIYCTTVKGVNELYDILRENESVKDRLVKYHAQLPAKEKEEYKGSFVNSIKNIMIATKAFGMGIDKDDISLIIHYDMPRSLEDYIQEVGRAGRGGSGAECYLLYTNDSQYVPGTLPYMVNWVISGKESSGLSYKPIYSQFSNEIKENIYFWSYYRICYIKEYCELIVNENSDVAYDFIIKYLKGEFSAKEDTVALDSLKGYIDESLFERLKIIAAKEFPDPSSGQATWETGQKTDKYHAEIKRLISEINELHINNTYVANLLRDHPDEYQLNEPYILSQDNPNSGAKTHKLSFTIHGNEKLSYFDMCVLDAIYTIEISHKETIYIQNIWEILIGRNANYYPQEKLAFRKKIQESIDKMREMRISLSDNQCRFKAENEEFLHLIDKAKGQKGYSYSVQKIPPLFRYAEEMNGQIIRVPVSLFNVAEIKKSKLWKEDLCAKFQHSELDKYSLSGDEEDTFSCDVKRLPQNEEYEPNIKNLISSKDYRNRERIKKQKYSFRPLINNSLLCHYLVRRIAISKKSRRGNYILFSTIKRVTNIVEDACFFNKTVVAIIDHYQNIGYLNPYYLYISDYKYRLSDGNELTDNAYFQVEITDTMKYWSLDNTGHLLLSDFTISWSSQDNGGYTPSSDTKRELDIVSLGRMDGIALRKGKEGE